ncbi:hypothetical protein KOI35_17610 [Actinoplanes bogorensis]|uniref:Uncharacterized protein n=1 Tax=Paractinoplanes bogorensis TaxID=1610840 RepID=A0ABS5YTF2_9ACTN|nr:hypothetical protein [Actinoplanes bogorensis]MBU2665325.1 hypothetical protein [Actinoplanes bogorensis]
MVSRRSIVASLAALVAGLALAATPPGHAAPNSPKPRTTWTVGAGDTTGAPASHRVSGYPGPEA